MSDTEGIQESEFQVDRVTEMGSRMSSVYSSAQYGVAGVTYPGQAPGPGFWFNYAAAAQNVPVDE